MLHQPTPAVPDGLAHRLLGTVGNDLLQRRYEEPADDRDDDDGYTDQGERRNLDSATEENQRQAGGCEHASSLGDVDSVSRETQQCGEQGHGRGQHGEDCDRRTDGESLNELESHEPHTKHAYDYGNTGEQNSATGAVHGVDRGVFVAQARAQTISVSSDDEQGVVDTDAEADHDADEGREVGNGKELCGNRQESGADEDAEERSADRKSHGEYRTERKDEDDDRERETDEFRLWRFELTEGLSPEQDVETFHFRLGLHQNLSILEQVLLRQIGTQGDVGIGQLPGQFALPGDLLCTLGAVG